MISSIVDWTPEEIDRIELMSREILIALPEVASGLETVAAMVMALEIIVEQADPVTKDIIHNQIREKFSKERLQ